MSAPYGTVKIGGRQVPLVQEPYLCGTNERPHYRATARHADGSEYEVYWRTVYDGVVESESDAADWGDYDYVQTAKSDGAR